MYTLILFIYAGMLARGDSVALTTLDFPTEQACIAAGKKAELLTSGTAKESKFICVKRG